MIAAVLSAVFAGGVMLPAGVVPANGNARAEHIAAASEPTRAAMKLVDEGARAIRDPALRGAVLDLVARPTPTFLAAWGADPDQARRALVDGGFLDAAVPLAALFPRVAGAPSFAAASGGVLGKHHGHPGGLAAHTAVNLHAARALAAAYRAQAQVAVDEDVVIAAAILHDAMKAWCLQFNDDGTLLEQPLIAGTSSHHIFIVAEALHRGLRDDVVVALAAAHEPPGQQGAKVAAFLAAAATLAKSARVTAPDGGLVVRVGEPGAGAWKLAQPPRIEASINHLSDHDYVLADPAFQQVDVALDAHLAGQPGMSSEPARRWRKHELLAKVPGLALYDALTKGGEPALRMLVAQ